MLLCVGVFFRRVCYLRYVLSRVLCGTCVDSGDILSCCERRTDHDLPNLDVTDQWVGIYRKHYKLVWRGRSLAEPFATTETFRGNREAYFSSFPLPLSRSFFCRFTCPVTSSLALALLTTTAVAQPGQITAAYHPRASSCFFSSYLQVFDCFSLATSMTATHANSPAAAFSRQDNIYILVNHAYPTDQTDGATLVYNVHTNRAHAR